MKVRTNSLELKDYKYHVTGEYECTSLFSDKVFRKGRFNTVIDKGGKVYSIKLSE